MRHVSYTLEDELNFIRGLTTWSSKHVPLHMLLSGYTRGLRQRRAGFGSELLTKEQRRRIGEEVLRLWGSLGSDAASPEQIALAASIHLSVGALN